MWRQGLIIAVLAGLWMLGAVVASAHQAGHKIEVLDDCDPVPPAEGPAWNLCALDEGDVTSAEFDVELISPDSVSVVGHQAWRNEPAYLKITDGETVTVKNEGGRNHTFTKVGEFGGGSVPVLNAGLTQRPQCVGVPNLVPGASQVLGVSELTVGNHRYQCCRHPWMRALIKVLPAEE